MKWSYGHVWTFAWRESIGVNPKSSFHFDKTEVWQQAVATPSFPKSPPHHSPTIFRQLLTNFLCVLTGIGYNSKCLLNSIINGLFYLYGVAWCCSWKQRGPILSLNWVLKRRTTGRSRCPRSNLGPPWGVQDSWDDLATAGTDGHTRVSQLEGGRDFVDEPHIHAYVHTQTSIHTC